MVTVITFTLELSCYVLLSVTTETSGLPSSPSLCKGGAIVVFVSHNSSFAPEICHDAQIAYQFYRSLSHRPLVFEAIILLVSDILALF